MENILRRLEARRSGNGEEHSAAKLFAKQCMKCSGPSSSRVAIIITAYLPIFTLQRRGRPLFRPWRLDRGLRLVGRAIRSRMLHVACAFSLFFGRQAREWHNPVLAGYKDYRKALEVCMRVCRAGF